MNNALLILEFTMLNYFKLLFLNDFNIFNTQLIFWILKNSSILSLITLWLLPLIIIKVNILKDRVVIIFNEIQMAITIKFWLR